MLRSYTYSVLNDQYRARGGSPGPAREYRHYIHDFVGRSPPATVVGGRRLLSTISLNRPIPPPGNVYVVFSNMRIGR